MKINEKQYLEFIKKTIRTNGYKVADIANKIALQNGNISTATYGKAAHMIVEAILG